MDLKELAVTKPQAGRHPWEMARADAVEHILRRGGMTVGGRDAILDFGCGDAYPAQVLTERFPSAQVYAIDKNFTPDVQTRLKPGLDKRIHLYDSLAAAEQAGLKASVVLLLDVLEHCESDIGVLEDVVESSAVAPGATFLLTVPAFQGLFSKMDEFLGHHRRYRLGELAEVARNAGLTVKDQSYFFSTLLLPRSVSVILQKLGFLPKEVKGLGDHKPRPVIDSLMRKVLWADFRFCKAMSKAGIYLPGLSCFVLAQKSQSRN